MNQKLKIRADFASYQCGGRYIPSKFECWTDEKGNQLKTPRTSNNIAASEQILTRRLIRYSTTD